MINHIEKYGIKHGIDYYNKIMNIRQGIIGVENKEYRRQKKGYYYKKDKEIDTYIFTGEKKKKKKIIRFDKKENPFNKLLSLNIK